jgi:hypothetical protein
VAYLLVRACHSTETEMQYDDGDDETEVHDVLQQPVHRQE